MKVLTHRVALVSGVSSLVLDSYLSIRSVSRPIERVVDVLVVVAALFSGYVERVAETISLLLIYWTIGIMTYNQQTRRRTVLRAAGSIAVMGLLAGCQSEDEEPESVESWLAHAKGYDNSIQDMTGNKSIAVTVGPDELNTPEHPHTSWNESQRHNNADDIPMFEPAAIEVSPGTTVTWKWEGRGAHNVVATDGKFDSGGITSQGPFSHTFKSPGTHYYYCEPHKESGMKGAVVVADSGTQSETSTH